MQMPDVSQIAQQLIQIAQVVKMVSVQLVRLIIFQEHLQEENQAVFYAHQ